MKSKVADFVGGTSLNRTISQQYTCLPHRLCLKSIKWWLFQESKCNETVRIYHVGDILKRSESVTGIYAIALSQSYFSLCSKDRIVSQYTSLLLASYQIYGMCWWQLTHLLKSKRKTLRICRTSGWLIWISTWKNRECSQSDGVITQHNMVEFNLTCPVPLNLSVCGATCLQLQLRNDLTLCKNIHRWSLT